MMQQLGVMLFKEREKMGVTQKNIAEGIISISELCRVERGDQEIDYFTLQALFERLGKSIDKLELAVSASEYESISYRIGIEYSIEEWDYEMLMKQLFEYNKYNDVSRPIHKQYMTALHAMVCYLRERDYVSCLDGMEHAIIYTLQGGVETEVQDRSAALQSGDSHYLGDCLLSVEARKYGWIGRVA